MKLDWKDITLGLFLLTASSESYLRSEYAANRILDLDPVTTNDFAQYATQFNLNWNGLISVVDGLGLRAALDRETGHFHWVSKEGKLISDTIDPNKMFQGDIDEPGSYSVRSRSNSFYRYQGVWISRDLSIRGLPRMKKLLSQLVKDGSDPWNTKNEWVLMVFKVGEFTESFELTPYRQKIVDMGYMANMAIIEPDGNYFLDPFVINGIGLLDEEDLEIIKGIDGWPGSWE